MEKEATILLYPNPTPDPFVVQCPKKLNIQQMSILNAQGLIVKTIQFQEELNELEVSVSDLAAGLYWIQFDGTPRR